MRLIDAIYALEEFLAEERQKKSIACCDYYDGYGDAIDNVDDWIDAQPTVDAVEVVHGRWVCLEAEIGYFACSKCDHRIIRAKCNYCPNCGAKMDGGNEDG